MAKNGVTCCFLQCRKKLCCTRMLLYLTARPGKENTRDCTSYSFESCYHALLFELSGFALKKAKLESAKFGLVWTA